MRLGRQFRILVTMVMVSLAGTSVAQPTDPVAPYRAIRDALIDGYRIQGSIDRSRLIPAVAGLQSLAAASSGELRTRALLELGTAQRLQDDYTGAVATLSEAARLAQSLGLRDLAFEAWIGVARAYEYGTSDHGAAAAAFDHALDAIGEQPTAKQRADLAGYSAQLKIGRGEVESGLIDALRAMALTANVPRDRFYNELDVADGLQRLAQSCDYRPLIDARTSDDSKDLYGACRRAVAVTRTAYVRAEATAQSLGWTFLVGQVREFLARLELRGALIEQRARNEALNLAVAFHPRSVRDVLVNQQFEAGASVLTDMPMLANVIDSVVAESDARSGQQDARSKYLLGLASDIRRGNRTATAEHFTAAAQLLGAERSGFFDLSRRGTVIENRGEIVRDLGMRLLTLGRNAEAFAAFESVRARGLSELAGILARPDITAQDRAWLAELLVLEARAAAIERTIVAEIVATGQLDASGEKLQALDGLRDERDRRLRAKEAVRRRFAATDTTPAASLDALRAAATRAELPVLLYWTTYANVVAWYVGPDGSDVRAVFLPETVLREKIAGLLASTAGSLGRTPFDETTARELYLFLLAPFEARLTARPVRQIMIVPQGTLAQLPFEALIDPVSGKSVIDRWAVSYAPNATMAVGVLQRETPAVRSVAALVDPSIDDNTNETEAIRAAGIELTPVTRSALFAGGWQADGLHILTHGEFDRDEALLSRLAGTHRGEPPILAADLLALPLNGLSLAVLSACKGGQVSTRLSGEIYGFPWVLLAGGTAATVLSRWDVNGDTNGKWMSIFYRELSHGTSPAMAAAAAMREMRNTGTTHPYYWAAMQVSGR